MYSGIKNNLKETEYLTEMARIGFTNDSHEIYVNTDDAGNIPHFHYRKRGSWDEHTCICLESAEYFHHGDKQTILSLKQRKELVNFLNDKPIKAQRYNTNWEYLLDAWNMNNSSVEVDPNLSMPNYLELK